ncbi:MAG: TolC family protein [Saprospiraceae bacterium]|nr:TolC family protein [Saprospiraceae bacterium]
MKIRILFIVFIIGSSGIISGASDTLFYQAFRDIVISNYPLIRKANLNEDISEAFLLKGRGALDSKFAGYYDRKRFDNKDYFTTWQSQLKIPTRLPVDLALGYENNDGEFLNPENSVPDYGLMYGTININLLRGLIFDDQRYNLRNAELKGIKSQIERDLMIREILFQANLSYLDWSASYQKSLLYEQYLNTISDRHQNIIQLFENGDNPAIDTVESRVNLNTAIDKYLQASKNLMYKRQKLELFIWDEEGNPLAIDNEIIPETPDTVIIVFEDISQLPVPVFENDPIIRKVANKIEQLSLENKLESENLKPALDVKFNTLVNIGNNDFSPLYSANDYKLGIGFEMPLQNRKTRGQLDLNKAMIGQLEWDQLLYRQKLQNDYTRLGNSISLNQRILANAQLKVNNSEQLYQAEVFKFELGESSVFLLNQRERKYLEARLEELSAVKDLGQDFNDLYYLKLGQEVQ